MTALKAPDGSALTSSPGLPLLPPLYDFLLEFPCPLFIFLVPLIPKLSDSQKEVIYVFRAIVPGYCWHGVAET